VASCKFQPGTSKKLLLTKILEVLLLFQAGMGLAIEAAGELLLLLTHDQSRHQIPSKPSLMLGAANVNPQHLKSMAPKISLTHVSTMNMDSIEQNLILALAAEAIGAFEADVIQMIMMLGVLQSLLNPRLRRMSVSLFTRPGTRTPSRLISRD
jgi:hypothetical protein